MSPFSDDDLKRLKDKVSNNPKRRDHLLMQSTVEALLARLEAAEAIVALYTSVRAWDEKRMNELLEIWKSTRGK